MKPRLLFMLLPLLLLGACSRNIQYQQLDVELAEQWDQPVTQLSDGVRFTDADWWQAFNSPALDQLIEQALASSPDLLMAGYRIEQAEAQLGITRASSLPGVSANVGAGVRETTTQGQSSRGDSSNASVSTSYEIDLWGRVAAERAAGQASLAATVHDWHAARLSLTAAVANSWFQWLSLEAQVQTAAGNLQAAEQQLQLIEARQQQGTATRADLARQRSQVINQRSSLQSLQSQQQQTRNALALLLGVPAQGFTPPAGDLLALSLTHPDPGMPTEILTRRPDLASSEARLRAADANIAAARAAIFPSMQLSASAALASNTLSLGDPVQTLGISASLTQSIFDHGLRKRQIALAQARQQELLESYRKTLLTALIEVEDALNRLQLTQQLETQQLALLDEQRLLATQTERLYRGGTESLSNLLDSQRSLAQAEEQLVQLRQARLNAGLDLYKALGGGWQ
ncbi:efflux transporter outer membrane subunit [Marinospirillum alkaliphilum]|uniref:Efflux transporter, outer membrane factor (OMF) lipoprotein, NodT family n=1 Tax=Marinospirillum alkaliphilum DSM 21637 TaxID=1122209 RepID=A0A1K1UWH7_9GAMM|nr:efflux transporter outer membrane subunit [Marinospirillum alkaliphilum]SFX17152.1 efflux transporter, outer membrane factor (OMF) lipoprotein, NodT family [Marinospirillum alkaliphilum DSM 21637]